MAENASSFDPVVDQLPSRYVVGIDLGTTNSAVTWIDTQQKPWKIQVLEIPQLVAAGEVESRDTLPSFHFQPIADAIAGGVLRLPWHDEDPTSCVGVMARDHSGKAPGRGIASAKSWLCHTGVDRTAPLLPWHAADDVEKLSPVEVSSRFLSHIRDAWDQQFPDALLAEQDLVVTLPASFDEVARELTIQAAKLAGLPRIILVEEPQAAFYAWVYKHQQAWQSLVTAGQKILVCDIGGGTTDFTLIRVRGGETDDEPIRFHRVAVGDHLILGGDNLDLALARHLESQLTDGKRLQPRQWERVVERSRQAKEQMLNDSSSESITISVPSTGAKLVGGSLQTELTRETTHQILVDGFLPIVQLDDKPKQHISGFHEFGLPYASDPAISRHLAAFLMAHRHDGESDEDIKASMELDIAAAAPDLILFNGGFFASQVLRERVLQLFDNWFARRPSELNNDRLDLAVARGAAYYGMVRRGQGVKIAANLARGYYIAVETGDPTDDPKVVCLVPGSAQPGDDFEMAEDFKLRISQPVEFSLFTSSIRLADRLGQLISFDADDMKPLPPIRTVLKPKNRRESGEIDVRLRVHLSEIGTIDLSCHEVGSGRSWRLQFDVRSATQTDKSGHEASGESQGVVDDESWHSGHRIIADVFAPDGRLKPNRLVKELADQLDMRRDSWPMSLLRRIWEALMEFEAGRRKSISHEARWLNLLGYTLRPGYGLALDDWRVAETWRTIHGKMVHASSNVQSESLILWRRIAGGLNPGQQAALAEPWISSIRGCHRRLIAGTPSKSASLKPEELVEAARMLGALERLEANQKIELADRMMDLVSHKKMAIAKEAMIWAIGRLGSRDPLYGPKNRVVQANHAWRWVQRMMESPGDPVCQLAVVQLARCTHDRYLDLANDQQQEVVDWLTTQDAAAHRIELVRDGGTLDETEQGEVFGETLPRGLRLE